MNVFLEPYSRMVGHIAEAVISLNARTTKFNCSWYYKVFSCVSRLQLQ